MALTDKEQLQQHYLAWKGLQDECISEFNWVLQHEAETPVETMGRVSSIVSHLDKIREKIAFATEQLTLFKERLQHLDKQEKGE